jgi:hypothetical protein
MSKAKSVQETSSNDTSNEMDAELEALRLRLLSEDEEPNDITPENIDYAARDGVLFANSYERQKYNDQRRNEENIKLLVGDSVNLLPEIEKTNNRSDDESIKADFRRKLANGQDNFSGIINKKVSSLAGISEVYAHVYSQELSSEQEPIKLADLVVSEANSLIISRFVEEARGRLVAKQSLPLLVISKSKSGLGRRTLLKALAHELGLKIRAANLEDLHGIQGKDNPHKDLAEDLEYRQPVDASEPEIIVFSSGEDAVKFARSAHSKSLPVLFSAPPVSGGGSFFGTPIPFSEEWDQDPLRYITEQHHFIRLRHDEFSDRDSFDALIHSILRQNKFVGDEKKYSRRHFQKSFIEGTPRNINQAVKQAKAKAEFENKAFDSSVLDEVLKNLSLRSLALKIERSDEDKKHTAYHEAGHALIHHFVANRKVVSISIIPDAGSLGRMELDDKPIYGLSDTEAHNFMQTLLAGRVAEKMFFNRFSSGAGDDLSRAYGLSRRMIVEWGMSEKVGPMGLDQRATPILSEQTRSLIDSEASELVRRAEKDCRKVLESKRELLEKVALRLLDKGEVDDVEFLELVKEEENRPFWQRLFKR